MGRYELPRMYVARADPALATPAVGRLLVLIYSNGRHDWVLKLPTLLEDIGFERPHLDYFLDRVELATANGEQHLATMEGFPLSLERKDMVYDAEILRQLLKDLVVEAVYGVALSMPRVVVVAQKV